MPTYNLNGLSGSRVPTLLNHTDEDLASTLGVLALDVPAGLEVEHLLVDGALGGSGSSLAVHGSGECSASLCSECSLGVDE